MPPVPLVAPLADPVKSDRKAAKPDVPAPRTPAAKSSKAGPGPIARVDRVESQESAKRLAGKKPTGAEAKQAHAKGEAVGAPAVESGALPVDEPVRKPEISAGLAGVLNELERADLDPSVVKRVQPDNSPRQRWWIWHGVKDSLRNYRRSLRRLREWWRVWRTGSSARVLFAFLVIYGLLAMIRKPSDVAAERSRVGEEIAFLQGFLKSYCATGGPVLARRPHGGAELYPRGIVMKGEVLDAFERANVGDVFAVHVMAPAWNPLEGFYGFPPVYSGGTYFHLERRVNWSLYRCSYLFRKDSELTGALLLSSVERAN